MKVTIESMNTSKTKHNLIFYRALFLVECYQDAVTTMSYDSPQQAVDSVPEGRKVIAVLKFEEE